MRCSESLTQCGEAESGRVCLELRGKSWKTSTTCSVLWSLTYFWSPWLLTSRFASCLLSCLHASTWYVIPFMLLGSLGFSPWLGFAFIGTFLGVSQKRPTWPSLSFCFRPLLNNITRKEKSPLGAIKTRMPCCWCFSSISGLSFLDQLANSFPCLADVLAWMVHAACSSGLTASLLCRKNRVFSLVAPEWTILGNSGWLAVVLGPLLGQGKEVLAFWFSWSLLSTPENWYD